MRTIVASSTEPYREPHRETPRPTIAPPNPPPQQHSGVAAMSLCGGDPAMLAASIGESSLSIPAKFCVAFPLSYHFIGGVRHAYWDATPEAVTNEAVEKASYAVAGGSLVLTGIACVL